MLSSRLATADDADTILSMMEDFNAIEAIAFERERFRPRLLHLVATPALGGALVFSVDGAVVGYAIVTYGYDLEYGGRDAFLTELYLVAARRGQGLGAPAVAAAEAFAHDNGAHALHLLVRHDNDVAQRLYKKRGFVVEPRAVLSKHLADDT